MTNQDIFNKVVKHAREQQCHAMSEGDTCMYRNPTGLKCFVGALIPDELYKPEMENQNVFSIKNQFPELNSIINDANINLLDALQGIHDEHEVCEWEEEFRRLADVRGLIYTPPKEVTDND